MVDSLGLTVVNRPAIFMQQATRKRFIAIYETRLNEQIIYPPQGEKTTYRRILELLALKKRLRPHVREKQDSVRFYFLCVEDVGRTEIMGGGQVTQDKAFYMQ
jgi:CRISPR/Cas system-associated endoribonuclease Cas2